MAFSEYRAPKAPGELPHQLAKSTPTPLNLCTILMPRDLTELNHRQPPAPNVAYVTQPDGRLMVGPGMPPIGGRYRFLAELSEGISAQVILAEDTWKPDRPHVAIKILRTMYADAGMMEARMLRFLQLHGPSDLGYIVQLYGCYKFEGHVCLVMERLHGTLLDLLFESLELDTARHVEVIRTVALQLFSALSFLHRRGIVHADLKPENILLTTPIDQILANPRCLEIRLVDFGIAFSVQEPPPPTTELQTLQYRAPEVLLGLPFAPAMDVWSAGCILAELTLRLPLFPAADPHELLQLMAQRLGHAPSMPPTLPRTAQSDRLRLAALQRQYGTAHPENPQLYESLQAVDAHFAQLAAFGLLRFDPTHRLTAEEVLRQPFFYRRWLGAPHSAGPGPSVMLRGLVEPGPLFSGEGLPMPARSLWRLRAATAEKAHAVTAAAAATHARRTAAGAGPSGAPRLPALLLLPGTVIPAARRVGCVLAKEAAAPTGQPSTLFAHAPLPAAVKPEDGRASLSAVAPPTATPAAATHRAPPQQPVKSESGGEGRISQGASISGRLPTGMVPGVQGRPPPMLSPTKQGSEVPAKASTPAAAAAAMTPRTTAKPDEEAAPRSRSKPMLPIELSPTPSTTSSGGDENAAAGGPRTDSMNQTTPSKRPAAAGAAGAGGAKRGRPGGRAQDSAKERPKKRRRGRRAVSLEKGAGAGVDAAPAPDSGAAPEGGPGSERRARRGRGGGENSKPWWVSHGY